MPGHRVHRFMANSEGDKNMSGSIIKEDMLRDALETCFGRWRRSAFWPHVWEWHMPERRGDVQHFGPQAFETRSLRRLIDAGFHFTYGPTEFCALIQTVSFCTTVQRKDFSLPHGLQRALRWMDIILGKQALEMDNGLWHILWSVWCYWCMTNWRNILCLFWK